MTRVATFVNGVQENARRFRDLDSAYRYADQRLGEFDSQRSGEKITDLSTNVSLSSGNVKMRHAYANGDSMQIWIC